jgi:hypothetical protein
MRHRPLATHDLTDVVVHAPPGFDPTRPLHVVMFFHGLYSRAAWVVAAGPLTPLTGESGSGWGLSTQHDLAGINALLVAPQLAPRGAAGFAGAFQRPGFLREFLEELLSETLLSRLGARHGIDDIDSLTMVGLSGGGPVIGTLLAHGDLAERVRNVVLDDALYGAEGAFAAWMQRSAPGAPRRFVCLTSNDDTAMLARAEGLAARLRAQGTSVAMQPEGGLAEAVRTHGAVFMSAACVHSALAQPTYDKVESRHWPPRAPGWRALAGTRAARDGGRRRAHRRGGGHARDLRARRRDARRLDLLRRLDATRGGRSALARRRAWRANAALRLRGPRRRGGGARRRPRARP